MTDRTDTERLDALEDKWTDFARGEPRSPEAWRVWNVFNNRVGNGPTLRAAIDAFLDAEKK